MGTWYLPATRHFFWHLTRLDSVLKRIGYWVARNILYYPIFCVYPIFWVNPNIEYTLNTLKYPIYPYLGVNRVPWNTRSNISTLSPDLNPPNIGKNSTCCVRVPLPKSNLLFTDMIDSAKTCKRKPLIWQYSCWGSWFEAQNKAKQIITLCNVYLSSDFY